MNKIRVVTQEEFAKEAKNYTGNNLSEKDVAVIYHDKNADDKNVIKNESKSKVSAINCSDFLKEVNSRGFTLPQNPIDFAVVREVPMDKQAISRKKRM